MIAITKKDIRLVLPLGSLEDLLALQVGLLKLISRQSESDPVGPQHLAPIADLLEATLFDANQLAAIEQLLKKQNPDVRPVGVAA